MAARTRRVKLDEHWKERIKIGVILDRLMKHFNGEVEMSQTQIKAADMLLKKVVPDLARTDIKVDPDSKLTITWEK